MKLDLLENPLVLSLILYILVLLIVYTYKPDVFDKDKNPDDSFLTRNSQFLLLLMPVLIYGFVSGIVTVNNRKKYCKILNMKNIDLKLLTCK